MAEAESAILGLVLVAFALSVTCSPLVADPGMATAACNSDVPVLSDEILHVFVWPLGHTVKCGVADVGLVTSVTVTPSMFAPEADSQIAKYAFPPGRTLLLPAKTSTLSHSFTVVEPDAMNAACWAVWPEPLGEAVALAELVETVGDGSVIAGDDAEVEDGDGDGDWEGDCAGDWLDEGDWLGDCVEDAVGVAVGVMVAVTQGSDPPIT